MDNSEKSPSNNASTSKESADDTSNSRPPTSNEEDGLEALQHTPTYVKELWKFHLRPADDSEPQEWWFASTAIPLLAATTGPLANVMSIAALVTSWRNNYVDAYPGVDKYSVGFPDPSWCVALNATSLVCGVAGNVFLLFNFTRRIRYIVALPMTIILWYFATGILIGITISINEYAPPEQPLQTYSQGFWHAVIAAILYLCSSMLLMVNMLGYFLGHYPQHFELTEEQRNLILQTMMFFLWLAGGAGVFARVCGWSFVDALYFCDVTVLTVGFGDFVAPNDAGRGLVFPFSVGGIIILGLMINSIRKFAQELGHDKVIKKHLESRRVTTAERSVRDSLEADRRREYERNLFENGSRPTISTPFSPKKRGIAFSPDVEKAEELRNPKSSKGPKSPLDPLKSPVSNVSNVSSRMSHWSPIAATPKVLRRVGSRQPKLLILREEKDRFNAMRDIQYATKRFKSYSALTMSIIAFGLLWCVGAVVFWQVEQKTQQLSYFEALYFCYVSLLTIGYGDLAPQSNAGKPFFIVWSLIAVPLMTILVSDLGDTVIASYKRGTFTLAKWTVLPQKGYFRMFLEKRPWLLNKVQSNIQKRAEKKRVTEGFPTGFSQDDPQLETLPQTLEDLANQDVFDEHDLARKLTVAIRRTANHLKADNLRRYSYEEWAEYSRLIRFTRSSPTGLEEEEELEGIIEWDWIGEDSPMLAEESESEWVLDRLCESMDRYIHRQLPEHVKQRRRSKVPERLSFNGRDGRIQEEDEIGALGLGRI